jgi:hypothetical protein
MGRSMAGPEMRQIEPLIREFSPPEALKKTFYQTFFGSLMGQTARNLISMGAASTMRR